MKIVWEGTTTAIAYAVDKLPRHDNYPFNHRRSSRYYKIEHRKITQAYFHQKGGGYLPGFAGVKRTAEFFVRSPEYDARGKWVGNGKGWPAYGYTLDVPYAPETTPHGKYIIYQCNDWDTVSWHTQGQNDHAVGIGFQGYFKSRHLRRFLPYRGTTGAPSAAQLEIAEDLWENFFRNGRKLGPQALRCHSDVGKPSCPGDALERWVHQKRQSSPITRTMRMGPPPLGDFDLTSWELRQAALVALGFDLGGYGIKGNGVDGAPGEKTRLAVEAIERSSGLPANGAWDADMEYALTHMLLMEGVTMDDIESQLP